MTTVFSIAVLVAIGTTLVGIVAVINAVHLNRQKHAEKAAHNHHHSPA